MKTETKTIALGKIIDAPWNTRSEISEASVRALAESIKADGLLQPLNVIKSDYQTDFAPGAEFICFDGCRRLNALKLLGANYAPCRVWDITEDEAKVKTVTANIQREDDDPLLAAKVIAEIGGDAEIIASKLGKTAAWVRRRAKLNALTDEIKAFVGKVTLEALERLSDFSADDQKKLAKKIENRTKYANGARLRWCEIAYDANQLTRDLNEAAFSTTECVGCSERSGADWFADGSEGLGYCLNCKCYEKKLAEHKAAKIAEVIPADAEKREIKYEWECPYEVREDNRKKRDKKHPCAWYWFEGDDLVVKWGKSNETIMADRDAERKRADDERKAEAAERERENKVEDAIGEWLDNDDNRAILSGKARAALKGSPKLNDLLVTALSEYLDSYDLDRVAMIEAFGLDADTFGGMTHEDLAWYIRRNSGE